MKPNKSALTPTTMRCAIYTRKSTTTGLEQEFNSLDAQREFCLDYIKRQPDWTVVAERYDDGGFTGANIERPAFQRLMADVEAARVDVVVVYKADRLSRSLLDFLQVMARFAAAEVSFVSVTQNFSTADAMGRLFMNMLMSFAEFERNMISERTRDKIAAARRKGMWTGGMVPFGYVVRDKKLVPDELEARVVREAFEHFVVHRQMAAVARILNEQKLLPRRRATSSRTGLRWTKDSVGRMIKNPIYGGWTTCGGELYPGEHPGILDASTYQRARIILDNQANGVLEPDVLEASLLGGLLRCGGCGGLMHAGATTRGHKRWRYYRCSTRDKRGIEACPTKALPAEAIEEFVVEKIAQASVQPAFVSSIEAALYKRIAAEVETYTEQRAKYQEIVAKATESAERVRRERPQSGALANPCFQAEATREGKALQNAEEQLRIADNCLEHLERKHHEVAPTVSSLRNFATAWTLMAPPNRRRLMRTLVDRIVVDEVSGKVRLELVTFAGMSGVGA